MVGNDAVKDVVIVDVCNLEGALSMAMKYEVLIPLERLFAWYRYYLLSR